MAQLTDDGTVWPEDQPPQTPPQPSLWQRLTTPAPGQTWSPLSIPGILGGMWSGLKDAASVPGDLYSGRLDLNDPNQAVANAGRLFNAAGTVSALGAPFAPTGPDILMAGARRTTAAAPAILANSAPTSSDVADILARGAQLRKGAWPQTSPNESLFDTSPEGYARTTDVAPQRSLQDIMPAPAPGQALPLGQRAAPIVDASPQIASAIADRLYPWVRDNDPRLNFYNTGPVYEKLMSMGIDPSQIMREWGGQMAATSPRTQTPPNLRNASLLLYNRGEGPGADPLTFERWQQEGNTPGYGMMGEQVKSAGRFWTGDASPNTGPKTYTYGENVQGNLASPTIDTHDIRSTLYQFDQLHPGQLPRQWFTSDEAFNNYRANGFPSGGAVAPENTVDLSRIRHEGEIPPGAINDSLASSTRGGVKKQIEFGPMTTPVYDASRMLNADPARVQAGKWFSYGGVTGLRSPVRSLSELLNDQLYDTARTIGVPPERVLEWWSKKLIPLTQNEAQPQQTQTQIG